MKTRPIHAALRRCTLAIACVVACCTIPPITAQHTVRVGTWNLENFGRRAPARTQAQIDAIGAFVRELRVDVLAVQEISDAAALAGLCEAIGAEWQFVLGTTGGFGSDPNRIAVGFVWNDTRVELLQAEELLQFPSRVDDLPVFHRKPVDAVFRTRFGGGFDFRAISVHLKAGRGGSYDARSKENEAKRLVEVRTLREHLGRLHAAPGEDRDIVVLGDFNHSYGESAHAAFTAGELVEYLRPAAPTPTIVHFAEPIDHIAITGGMHDELRAATFTVHGELAAKDKTAWREVYSDHVPVTVDLQADVDRDAAATFTPVGHDRWLAPGGAAAATASGSRTVPAYAPRPADGGPDRDASSGAGTIPQPAPTNPPTETLVPATAQSNAAAPLRNGDAVRVEYQTNGGGAATVDGTLTAPLGDWVQLTVDPPSSDAIATRIAIPRERVLTIVGR